MPELPEVETSRAFVACHCVKRTVQDAIVADDESEGLSPLDLF